MLNDPSSQLADAELVNVFVKSFSARLVRLADVETLNLEIGMSWAKQDGGLLFAFDASCHLYDADVGEGGQSVLDEHLLAELVCQIVCEYALGAEALSLLKEEVVKSFAEEAALVTAFPYVREAMSSMSNRLGFTRVTLGVLRSALA